MPAIWFAGDWRAGQQKLKAARVLVIGAGGLGSPCILYLAAAGVGTIGIVDDDVVSLSNLQRQIIHDTDSVGASKTTSGETSIARINPHVNVKTHHCRLVKKMLPIWSAAMILWRTVLTISPPVTLPLIYASVCLFRWSPPQSGALMGPSPH